MKRELPVVRRRVALVLSGCGVHDGTEVHEASFAWLALERLGMEVVCVAPDVPVATVIDHSSGAADTRGDRSVLAESARIARGPVRALRADVARDVAAAVFPGGYGVTRTLTDFARVGRGFAVMPAVAEFIVAMHAARKPQVFMCTAPLLAARVLGANGVRLTIGNDDALASELVHCGAVHVPSNVASVVVDHANRVVSTPAFLAARGMPELADGIDRAMRAMAELMT